MLDNEIFNIEIYKKVSVIFNNILNSLKQNKYFCTNFLSPIEQNILFNLIKQKFNDKIIIEGGFENAIRKVFYCINSDSPVLLLKAHLENHNLTHSDILGFLLNGCQFNFEKIGDIFIDNNNVFICLFKSLSKTMIDKPVFLKNKLLDFKIVDSSIFIEYKFKQLIFVTNSLRIDKIISCLTNKSRDFALNLIKTKSVYYEFAILKKPFLQINKNTILSIKGMGRFLISEIDIINVDKYRIYINKFI